VENFVTNNWTVGVLFLDRSGSGTPRSGRRATKHLADLGCQGRQLVWNANDSTGKQCERSAACQPATPCTWTQVLALFPIAGVWNSGGGLIFKTGGPVGSNFDGNLDAFILRHNGALITYNFENVP
jgi:hypothetical protein